MKKTPVSQITPNGRYSGPSVNRLFSAANRPAVLLVLSCFLFSATVFAYTDDSKSNRKEKLRIEKKTSEKKTVEKVEKVRKPDQVKEAEARRQKTVRQNKDTEVRKQQTNTSNRGGSENRSKDQYRNNSGNRSGQADNNDDNRAGNRNNNTERERSDNNRPDVGSGKGDRPGMAFRPDKRFKHERERCAFCIGVGFTFSHDHFRKIRCPHCRGRGFAIAYHSHLNEFCPLCYTQLVIIGTHHYWEPEEIADRMTRDLELLLDLTPGQARRIYRINLKYLRDSRHGDLAYYMERRDMYIMEELTYRQRDMYLTYLREVDSRDLCDNCFALR